MKYGADGIYISGTGQASVSVASIVQSAKVQGQVEKARHLQMMNETAPERAAYEFALANWQGWYSVEALAELLAAFAQTTAPP